MEKKEVRTRIAPSPTGYPHIGTVYQALFDWAYARKHNGKFFVRIEDTDRERFVEGAEDVIFGALDWFGLQEDESPRKPESNGPYRQSERLAIYTEHAKALVEKNRAYYCFCTKERLAQIRDEQQKAQKQPMYDKHCRFLSPEEIQQKLKENIPYVIRMAVPENTKVTVVDQIRGEIEFNSSTIDDQVIIKSDGYPTYHLAVVVDDHAWNITHVVRGEEWLTSLPKHWLLYEFFGWEKPLFFHTPVLRNPDKSKLSKRHGHTSVSWYQEAGFLPEALLNFLALMGWSHPQGKEVFSLEEFISLFDLKDLKAVGPIFDLKKLEWMNGVYIRGLEIDKLRALLKEFYKNDPEVLSFLNLPVVTTDIPITLAQTRMVTLADFKALVVSTHYVYSDEDKQLAQNLIKIFKSVTPWNKEKILEGLKKFTQESHTNMKTAYILLTGKPHGLPLPEMLEVKGKDATIQILEKI